MSNDVMQMKPQNYGGKKKKKKKKKANNCIALHKAFNKKETFFPFFFSQFYPKESKWQKTNTQKTTKQSHHNNSKISQRDPK